MTGPARDDLVRTLASAGCVSPGDEADALVAAASEGVGALPDLLERRLRGEPLAWVVGSVRFCDRWVRVEPGVFVPRPHTEPLARRAADLLPAEGLAVDLCTGSGAVAVVMRSAHPHARVVGTDLDPIAVACARSNGVRAFEGDLDAPLPRSWRGRVDVITAVVPYVPSEELHVLPRDVLANEPIAALDGGPRGMRMLARVVERAPGWLRAGGHLLLELGGDQAADVEAAMDAAGFDTSTIHRDEEGQDRAIEARLRA